MNDLVRIAQAITPANSGTGGGGENAALPIELLQPAAGTSVTATRLPGQLVDFRQILNEDISFIRIGGDLQMIFANGGDVIVQDFFAGEGADQVAVVFDGETISIDQFISVANLQVADEVQTAAGETSNLATALGGPQGSGQDFQDASIGELGPGLDVFDLLIGEGPGTRGGSIDEFTDGEVNTVPTVVSAADAGAIDEGNLADGNEAGQGPLVATGSLGINFGENAGQSPTLTFDTNGAGVPLDSAGNPLDLSSDGVALTYAIVSNADGGQTLTATKQGTGETVFTVTLDIVPNVFAGGASGAEYVFTLEGNLDHLGADFDESLPVSFSITATDTDGDSVGTSFLVSVADDDVEIGASDASSVDEDGLTDGNVDTGYDGDLSGSAVTSSGGLGISWGSDNGNPTSGGGTGDRSVAFSVAQPGLSGLTSNGNSVSIAVLADGTLVGYTGDAEPASSADGSVVFLATLSDADSGSYEFTLVGNLDHSEAGTEDDIILSITYTATDGDGDAASSTFEVTVDDDAPVIVETSSARVDEDDLAGTQGDLADGNDDAQSGDNTTVSDGILDTDGDATTVAGDLAIEWGADASNSVANGGTSSGNGDRSVTFATTAIATLEALALTSHGEALSYELSNGDSVLTATSTDGRVVFTVTLSDENSGSFVLDLNDALDHPEADFEDDIALTFDFTATDSDGDSASSSFQITVDDDSPVLTGDVRFSQVDEEGLAGGNVGESYPDNEGDYATGGARDDATTSGRSLNISWGADDANSTVDGGASTGNGDRSVEFASADVLVSRGTTELDALTSRGETVEFRLEDNGAKLVGYVASSTFNGGSERVVFEVTLSDQDNGSYDFEILDVLDHQGAGKEDNIRLTFDFTATDSDGDSVDGTFAVRVDDDAPVLDDVSFSQVDEDGLAGGNVGESYPDNEGDYATGGARDDATTSGRSLNISWGADDANSTVDGGASTGNGDRSVEFASADVLVSRGTTELDALTSRGETVEFRLEDNGAKLVGYVASSTFNGGSERVVFEVTLSDRDNGSYDFEILDVLDHQGAGKEDNIRLTFDFTATDSDGDSVDGTFAVRVDDDAPVLDDVSFSQVDEDGLAGGNVGESYPGNEGDYATGGARDDATTSGRSLNISWGADDANSTVDGGASTGNGDRSVEFASADVLVSRGTTELDALTSRGETVEFRLEGNGAKLVGYVASSTFNGGSERVVFEVTLSDQDNGSYDFEILDVLDHQGAGKEDNIRLTFDFTATDSDGDSVDGTFAVRVDDDAPVLDDVRFSQVDEDGLAGGNVGESYPDNEGDYATGGARDDATTSGRSLNISWGADDANSTVDGGASTGNGDRSVAFASADVLVSRGTTELDVLTSRGETVEFRLEDNGAKLVGYVASSTFNGGSERVVFEVTLSDQDNGSYDFEILDVLDHQGAGKEDNIRLTFDFTATDSDGDSVDGAFAVRVDDDAPVVDEVVTATVDEDDIVTPESEGNGPFDGDADGSLTGPFDALFGPAISSGSIANTVNFGADGAAQTGAFAFASDAAATMETLGLSSNGETLSFEVISVGGTSLLVGFVDDGDGSFDLALDRPVLGLALSEDGDYAVLLNDQLDHVSGGGENSELVSATGPLAQIDFGAVIEATDGDGDTIGLSGQFLVDVTDDVPEPEIWVDDYVRIDETHGEHSDNVFNPNTGQYNPRVVNLFNNVSVTGSDVDLVGPIYARYDVVDYSLNGGADDQATRTLELRIDDPDSGLFTTENEAITLSMEGDLVVGRIDTGEAVFAIHIDLRGRVSIVQYQSLKHDDTSTSDEHIDLAGKISAVLTVTDADGDAVSADVAIGADVTFDDDGPDAFRRGSNVRLDEAGDLNTLISGQLQFDGGADGATVTGISITSNGDYVRGIDREESGAARRGDLTSDGTPITWTSSVNASGEITVEGVLEGSGITAFQIIVQPDGSYTYQQFVSFDHPDDGQTGADDQLAIRMDFTVTDGDGDTDTASALVVIDDGGPEAGTPEIETVFEDGTKVLSDISLEIEWGADDGNATSGAGAGDRSVSFADTTSAAANVSFRDANGDLTELRSNGELVQFTFIGGVFVGFTGAIEPTSLTDSTVVLTVALSDAAAGSYSFELVQPVDHLAPVGTDHYIDLTFSFNATDSDQDVSEDSSFTVRVDAAGTISSIDYSVLSTGVFVNLSDSEQTEQGQTVSANTATDRSGVSSLVVGEDDVSGIIDAVGGSSDDILIGDDSANHLQGSGGNDLLVGLGGNDDLSGDEGDDRLRGGAGFDRLDGGQGTDTADYSEDAEGIYVRMDHAWATALANKSLGWSALTQGIANDTVEHDDLVSIENIIGTDYRDLIVGDSANNAIWGGGGNDRLAGLEGDDELFGGEGNDLLLGGSGTNLLDGGEGIDTVDYSADTEGVYIRMDHAWATSVANNSLGWIALTQGIANGTVEHDDLVSIENLVGTDYRDLIVGNDVSNTITGGGGNDRLDGQGGDDDLFGGEGNDRLLGGEGSDLLDGGEGTDAAEYSGDNEGVYVRLDQAWATDLSNKALGWTDLTQGIANETVEHDDLVSIENIIGSNHRDLIVGDNSDNKLWGRGGDDLINGLDGADSLYGEAGQDELNGGSGEDLLAGGLGADTLTGGEDADTFVLDSLAEADIITDYTFDDGDKFDLGDLLDAAFKSGELTEDLVRATENVDGSVKIEVDLDGAAAGHDWQEAATLEDHASMGDTIRIVMDNDGSEVNVSVA
ncbi:DUF5801 repeats-in-toxin domain-containing protein [Roseibium sp. SCPC15]|uniref:T1SS-143 repeat domain-containing protein n=1 Tax=Roseibium sp. SCP15 TaxID=3141376 RepID=UPI00333A7947